MKIGLTSIYVDDQDRALRFYTEVLGFVKKTEIPLGEHAWLTVVSPEDPGGTELSLEPDEHPAARPFKQALVEDGIPFTSFAVHDVAGGQRHHGVLGVAQLAPGRIQPPAGEAVDRVRRRAGGLGPAQDGADARQQLARVEGLGQIVVRTQLQPDDAVGLLGQRRQHDDRQPRRGAQPAADGEPVLPRQHEVEHDEIEAAVVEQPLHRLAVGGGIDAKAVPGQEPLQQVADLPIVVDDEQMGLFGHGLR